ERTVLQLPGTSSVAYLGDLAEVTRGYVDPPTSAVGAGGVPALALAVSMRTGGNLVDLGERVQALYEALPERYPHGIEFQIAFFEPNTVDTRIDEFLGSVGQSVAIVLVVMLLFLGLRTGTVVASLIPTTMIITMFVMALFDIWIDQISLAALIISLGLLVDNAIVMSEATLVRMTEGEAPFDAAVASARELAVPLLTSSLTTAAAFLPIFLAESNTGEYTAPLFKVVTISLLISWGLSLTMIPLLCVTFLRAKAAQSEQKSFESRFYRLYRGFLRGFLRFRLLSLVAVIAAFFGIMQLMAVVPKIFFPPTGRSFFIASFELPTGTPIERTQALVSQIDRFMQEELLAGEGRAEGVKDWTSFVGATPPRFVLSFDTKPPEPQRATYMLNTTSFEAVEPAMAKLRAFADESLPDAETWVRPLQNGPPVTKPVMIRLSGKDIDRLFEIAGRVQERLGEVQGTRNIGHNWGSRVKKFVVDIDGDRARRAGVSHLDVAVSLQTFLSGMQVTTYREDEDTIPVVLRSVASDRQDIDRLETLNVFSQSTGQSVPLSQVADIELAFQPSVIKRRDRYRTVTVESELSEGVTAFDVVAAIRPWLDQQQESWPVGYRYEIGGEIESSGKANASIAAKVPVGILFIVLLLVWQFNSLRKPVIILATIPLAMMGVVLGLLTMRSYFGFMTLLGVISLAGIVINNAIVLLERIQLEIDENGLTPQAAILEAAQRRLRPILLTTATTIASLLPLYLGGGPMFEPMAVAIMFGLAFATVLTLGVVPLLYSLFFRVSFRT
ncbi:MAG: efflux RND transporter permease subunit, partial [Myxococcales bacterium]|nr:efflux RND transporter permease subunit [Myxococcales bacterium]